MGMQQLAAGTALLQALLVAGAALPAGVGVQQMAAGAAALLQAQHQFLLSLTLHLCSALNPKGLQKRWLDCFTY